MIKDILVLDTETTGMDPDKGAEVIQVACRLGLEDEAQAILWNVKPLHGVTPESTAIHGITDEMTREWPTFGEVADKISWEIARADVLIGYNPDYDVRMLAAEFKRCGMKVKFPGVIVCMKRFWDRVWPRPPRDLSAAYREFVDAEGFEGAHGALADTMATARVARAMIEKADYGGKEWEEFDPERVTWWGPSNHVVWREGVLVCNFGKNKDKPFHLVDAGMLRWIMTQDFPRHVKDLCERSLAIPGRTPDDKIRDLLTSWAKGQW